MKRCLVTLIVFLMLLASAMGETHRTSHDISFTAGLIANFGFTTMRPSSSVKPSLSVPDPMLFDFYEEEGVFRMPRTYYAYYQVFTPDTQKLKISVIATSLWNDEGGEVIWTDLEDNFECKRIQEVTDANMESNKQILADSVYIGGGDDKGFGSFPFRFEVDADTVDFTKVYNGSITLYVESV